MCDIKLLHIDGGKVTQLEAQSVSPEITIESTANLVWAKLLLEKRYEVS
jgi:hypothetical protein